MKEIYIKVGIIVSVLFVLVFSYSSTVHTSKEKPKLEVEKKPQVEAEPIMVSVQREETIEQIDLDNYLLGVVAGEMPASFELEALKAQVVASRTFAFKRGLQVDATTMTQVYITEEQMQKNWQEQYDEKKAKIEQAIVETKDEVMMYQGDYISALFFSSANGYTENSHDYFIGQPVPYLQSVESPWDAKVDTKYTREKQFTKQELKTIFDTEDTVDFHIVSYKESGRIETLTINAKEYSGREVREKLSLASSCFTISVTEDVYTFTSVGSGHGVGMSQYGAQGMALEGYSYYDILQHYYTGIEIVKNGV